MGEAGQRMSNQVACHPSLRRHDPDQGRWHRLSLAQFAAVLAAPLLATRGVVALGNLGVQAICARVVHKLAGDAALGRYSEIAAGPGFARAA
jgi:hypothetical protein